MIANDEFLFRHDAPEYGIHSLQGLDRWRRLSAAA
jgi:hypothetical protein